MSTQKLGSCFALIMLITGAIDSIRNLPATALFGTSLLFFCLLAAALFLIPIAMVSAHLSRNYPELGGVYEWIRHAFGKPAAVIGIWLQWINTLIWYPTILIFISATFAYLINPALAANKAYLVIMIISIFWAMSIANLFGVRISSYIASVCAIAGVFVPLICIVGLAIYWIASGHTIQFDWHHHWIPHSLETHSWVALTAIITSFLGVELASVHHRDISHAEQMFPRALFISVILIVATMILGSLAIACVLPVNRISLISGVMTAFSDFFTSIHAPWMRYVMSFLLVIGSLGGLINWIISPSKGILQAAADGYLPRSLARQNRHHVPFIIILLQACMVSLIALVYIFIPSINSAYWLLTDLSTELYVIMYVLLLSAAIFLGMRQVKCISSIIWGALGIIGCITALFVGFLAPQEIHFNINYQLLFGLCLILMVLPALGLLYYKRRHNTLLGDEE